MNALAGIGVAVTREEPAGGPLGLRLTERGARVHLWPTVRSVPPSDPTPLADALARLPDFDWVVCTSARAVEALPVASSPAGPRLAAVGRGTARAARARGWAVACTGHAGAVELGRLLVEGRSFRGRRVLVPLSSLAGDELTGLLREAGAEVERVTAYETRVGLEDAARCRSDLESGEVRAITFCSPSAAEGFGPAADWPEGRSARCVALGATTGARLRALGWAPAEADDASFEGLACAVERALTEQRA